MPTVPTYNPGQVQPSVGPSVRRSVDAPIEAFGGGVSRVTDAAQGLLDVGAKVALKEKERQDDIRVQDAYAQAVKAKNARFWDPKEGAVTRRGRDAAGVIDEYTPLLDQDFNAIEESLGNEDQKAQFRNIRSKLSTDFNDNLMKHSYSEGEKFAEETHKSVIENNQNDTVLNFPMTGDVEKGLKLQQDTIVDYAQKHGKGAEWVKLEVGKETTNLHMGVLNQLLSTKQDLKARDYFEKYKDQFADKDDKAKAQAAIHEGYTKAESQRQASALYSASRGNLKDALDGARKIKDADVQAATVAEIKVRHAEMEAIRTDQQQANMRKATQILESTRGTGEIPPAILNGLPIESRNALDKRRKDLREGALVVTDLKKFYGLKLMGANATTREEFKKVNLLNYVNDIDEKRLSELMELQAGVIRGDEKTLQKLDGVQSKETILRKAIETMWTEKQLKTKEYSDQEARFRDSVEREVEEFQRAKSKPITNVELSEIVKRQQAEVVLEKGYIWDTKKRAFDINIQDVPSGDRAEIEQSLKQAGVPVTDDAIVRVFSRGKRGR